MRKHGKLFVSWQKFEYLDRNMLQSGRVVEDEKLVEYIGQRGAPAGRDLRECLNGVLLYALPGQLLALVSAALTMSCRS